MNEHETIQWLKVAFSRGEEHAVVDKNYTRLVSPEIILDTPNIQSYIMNNWWNSMFSIIRQKTEDERLPLFINKLNWHELIEVKKTYR